jgi:Spy/CpxP family protein refolding chaperone
MKWWSLATVILVAVTVTTVGFAYGTGHGRLQGDNEECWRQGTGPAAGDESLRPGAGGHRAQKLARYLDLSQEQTDKMVELRRRYDAQMKTIRDELLQRRVEARNLYTDPKTEEGVILAKQSEISSLKQRLSDDAAQLRLEQRRILTPEQLKKLAEFKPRHEGHRRGKLFS